MKSSKAKLFLIELIIIILFFSLAAAVCMQIFAGAHTLSQKSEDLTEGIMIAQQVSEEFHSGMHRESEVVAYFDEDWQPIAMQSENYVSISVSKNEGINQANICVYSERGLVYELTAGKYDE